MPKHNPDLTGRTIGSVLFVKKLPILIHRSVAYRARNVVCGHEWDCRGSTVAKAAKAGEQCCPQCKPSNQGSTRRKEEGAKRTERRRRWAAGETLQHIADSEGVTKQAVVQSINKTLSNADVPLSLSAMPPAELLAAVLATTPLIRRKVLIAALDNKGADGRG